MTSVSVCVLIASIRYEIDIFFSCWNIWSENLPIVSAVLKLNFAMKLLCKVFSDAGRAREECHSCISLLKNLLHDGTITVDIIHIFFGQTAVVHHANPLLNYH